MSEKDKKYLAPALVKGLQIIELLSHEKTGLTLSDISEQLQRSRNELFRMLSTLEQFGYLCRDKSSDRYSLTLKMFVVAQRYPPIEHLNLIAVPKMRALTLRTWQSCHIGMENDGAIVVVASIAAPGSWGFTLRTGTVIGLTNTGTGRVLAAFRKDDELEELLERHQPANGEPEIDKPTFLNRISKVREQGYDCQPSETVEGVINLAFPVLDHEGRAVYAVNCPYVQRIDRFKVPDLLEVQALFQSFAQELTTYFTGNSSPTNSAG